MRAGVCAGADLGQGRPREGDCRARLREGGEGE